LKEDQLVESRLVDHPGAFNVNWFIFTDAMSKRTRWPLNGDRDGDGKFDGIDWNGNGRPPLAEDGCGVIKSGTGLPVGWLIPGTCADRIDNGSNFLTCKSGGTGQDGLIDEQDPDCIHDQALPPINLDNAPAIASCTNAVTDKLLTSFDDWLHISLPFQQFPASRIGAFEPMLDEPSLEELLRDKQDQETAQPPYPGVPPSDSNTQQRRR
jgi:hypothetical protein